MHHVTCSHKVFANTLFSIHHVTCSHKVPLPSSFSLGSDGDVTLIDTKSIVSGSNVVRRAMTSSTSVSSGIAMVPSGIDDVRVITLGSSLTSVISAVNVLLVC